MQSIKKILVLCVAAVGANIGGYVGANMAHSASVAAIGAAIGATAVCLIGFNLIGPRTPAAPLDVAAVEDPADPPVHRHHYGPEY